MSKLFGFIGEDISDYETFVTILEKYLPKSKFRVKKFLGKGHGKISSKAKAWTENLFNDGCQYVFIVQDKDSYDLKVLRKQLSAKISGVKDVGKVAIVIPTKEMESWLLTDSSVFVAIFGLSKTPKQISDPEALRDPKKEIADIVRRLRKNDNVIYLNTEHNREIAASLSTRSLCRCKSFHELHVFIEAKIAKAKSA